MYKVDWSSKLQTLSSKLGGDVLRLDEAGTLKHLVMQVPDELGALRKESLSQEALTVEVAVLRVALKFIASEVISNNAVFRELLNRRVCTPEMLAKLSFAAISKL